MSRMLGLDPERTRATAALIDTQVVGLEMIQAQIMGAQALSMSPLGLMPGSLVIAPWSMSQASAAYTDIVLAKGSARELAMKLRAEAATQEFVSSAADASYETGIAWRVPDARDTPKVDFDDFVPGPFRLLEQIWREGVSFVNEWVGRFESWISFGLDAFRRWAPDAIRQFDEWWAARPGWVRGISRLGKIIPIVGTGIDLVDLAFLLKDGFVDGDWDIPGLIRVGGSLVIDAVSIVAGATGVGIPVLLALQGVGILWDLGWIYGEHVADIVEHPDEYGEFLQDNWWWYAPLMPLVGPIIVPFIDLGD